ncbi:hypothetical protein GCM10018791_09630 [Streptomyces zaomyceticus]|nr:hypothetical protein GCM10018791_09630 [Streptomyces zaomyceticus]
MPVVLCGRAVAVSRARHRGHLAGRLPDPPGFPLRTLCQAVQYDCRPAEQDRGGDGRAQGPLQTPTGPGREVAGREARDPKSSAPWVPLSP